MAKSLLEDGAGLKLMVLVLDPALFFFLLIFWLRMARQVMSTATSFLWLSSILTGFSATGNQTDAIFGRKSAALTSSGTEWVMSTLSNNARASSTNLEIAPMPPGAAQPEAASKPHLMDIGLELLWLNVTADKEILQLSMLSALSKLSRWLIIRSLKLLRNFLKLSAHNTQSTSKRWRLEFREFWWEDIQETVMQVAILGNCWQPCWLKLSIKAQPLWWNQTVSRSKKTERLGLIFSSFLKMPPSMSKLQLQLAQVMQSCIDFTSMWREIMDILLSKSIEAMVFKNQPTIWPGASLTFWALCSLEKRLLWA
jgi:hypothetical protein